MAVQCVIDVSTMGLPTVSDCWSQDDDWSQRRGVGLSNLGNTCYQNAILQCLIHNKRFVSLLSTEEIPKDSLADHLLSLALNRDNNSIMRADGVREAMAKRHSWLGDGRQHDAQEFLVLLLDQLHDQLKRCDVKRVKVAEEDESTREWRQFLHLSGSSLVSDTFQGQLCSTVTCLDCQRTSRAFEPFMYLCVPVPISLETTIHVIIVDIEAQTKSIDIKVENKYEETVLLLKRQLKELNITQRSDEDLLVADVDASSSHVRRLLEDNDDLISYTRLHVFELNHCCGGVSWRQNCPICLEGFESSSLVTHSPLCSSAVCQTCLSQLEHYGHQSCDDNRFLCHSCGQQVSRKDFTHTPERCQFPIPLLFRSGDRLLSRVHVLRVCAQMDSSNIYSLVDSRVPFPECTYRLIFVERDANGCCRCSWGASCDGCELSRDGSISLLPSDTLCVVFAETPDDWSTKDSIPPPDNPLPASQPMGANELHLNDCLRAFATSETSDWFCAHCNQERVAYKTMRLTREPQTLIISLKRFLFFGQKSHKIKESVDFPKILRISPLLSETKQLLYRLQAVVLHSGQTVSSGHYSAFVRQTDQWLLCNDDAVTEEDPPEGDSRAYILFYSRDEEEEKTNDTIDAIISTIDSSV